MTGQQVNDMVVDYILSKNPYALVKKAWLGKDKYGHKVTYENADCERTTLYLNVNSKDEVLKALRV